MRNIGIWANKGYVTQLCVLESRPFLLKWAHLWNYAFITFPNFFFFFRYVYKWFLLIYKVSYCIGILGYVIMMATFLGLHFFFGVNPHIWLDAGLLLMFYALYYGVMARDVAEICTEKMVSQIGVSIDFAKM